MSFAIKKNNEITYISQNSATSGSSSSNAYNSVLYVNSSTNLTTSSPNVVILTTNGEEFIRLPLITTANDGLTFTIRYYGTTPQNSTIQSSGGQNMYISNTGTVTSIAFNTGAVRTLIAYNSEWYNI